LTSDAPAVSVVVPAHNSASFIGASIRSALRQTFADLEVIVVDDGSRDDTVEIVRGCAHVDPRLRVIEQPNAGVVAARNHGLDVARGRWIAFLDSDDLWHPEKLAAQVSALRKFDSSDPVVIGTMSAYFGRKRGPLGRVGVPTSELDAARVRTGRLMPFLLSSTLVSRSAIDLAGPFADYMNVFGAAQDLELISRCARLGCTVLCLDRQLTFYRLRRDSVSASSYRQQRMATRFVREIAAQARDGEPDAREFIEGYTRSRQQVMDDRTEDLLRRSATEYVDGTLAKAALLALKAVAGDPRYAWQRATSKLVTPSLPSPSRRKPNRHSSAI
jgi:glycosyltransferase involved in cell wall biosynthesis